jgi:hypothetical protein
MLFTKKIFLSEPYENTLCGQNTEFGMLKHIMYVDTRLQKFNFSKIQ